MPQLYSINGNLVSKEKYEKFHGIAPIEEKVEVKEEVKKEVKKVGRPKKYK